MDDFDEYSIAPGWQMTREEFDIYLKEKAARRAIGFVNKLRPGPTKVRHAKRVFKNFNQLRAAS